MEKEKLDINIAKFQGDLLKWYGENKRDLPWRRERDPYRIWVSEIMLQQTKVDTVIPYFERFMSLFPTLDALADAEEETVLKAWEGLGYYSRARNLHQAVKEVKESYNSKVPHTEEIHKLKGVGPYTAGAILSIAYGIPAPAVDGNVMRVLSRIFLMKDDISKVSTRKKFEALVEEIISQEQPSDFNQALMELGALICTPRSPSCLLCPVQAHCEAREEGIQEQLPVKIKKTAVKEKNMKAVVLMDKAGKVLIEQRPDTGLLAKLWQFPNIEGASKDISDITNYMEAEAGLKVNIVPEVKQHVKHVFSHLIWKIDVYIGTVDEIVNENTLKGSSMQFVEKEDVDWYPFPVSHQKIMDGILKGDIENWIYN
ncbi:A/G-specific adenine glycosylase [Evansella vedderi]|uniref:Adenine DNA glycosylase n=1 Tax=Evansella vedderi TaxID=38282 RepID=A0ABU0A1K4_9BACI|nr:A/G-specific adenine glycosylase [Evansella vedderi]MDQ0256887.1 A/G-specific adenine glycosylase [Evansella vedderi]